MNSRITRLLSIIFFFSGCSVLLYQMVWQRALTMLYGVGPISITIVISVFLGGLGIGGWIGGRFSSRSRSPFLLYASIEAAIGVYGLCSIPLLNVLERTTAGAPLTLVVLWCVVYLLIPTTLMGMTLPVLTYLGSLFQNDWKILVAHLYFINTLGAAMGCFLSAFFFFSFFGLLSALLAAVAINFLLAFATLRIQSSWPMPPREKPRPTSSDDDALPRPMIVLIFITGFLAIGYEMAWSRLTNFLVKDSPYAFAAFLTIYLLGLAWGGLHMKRYLRRPTRSWKPLFFLFQIAIALYVGLTVLGLTYLPQTAFGAVFMEESFYRDVFPPIEWFNFSKHPAIMLHLGIFVWPLLIVLIPATLMGASFPLVAALSASPNQEGAAAVGNTYFWTVAGNVTGGIITGLLVLPLIGLEKTLAAFILIGFMFALSKTFSDWSPRLRPALLSGISLALLFGGGYYPLHGKLFEVLSLPPLLLGSRFVAEGVDGLVVTDVRGKEVNNAINGMPHGSRPGWTYQMEALETIAHSPHPQTVLVIGFGAGALTQALLRCPDVQEIILVELSGTLMKNFRKTPVLAEPLNDPRVHVVIDDGRRFLRRVDRHYDLIFIDALRSTTAYSGNLFSEEFFQLVRKRLHPQGLAMVWSNETQIVPFTLAAVFPYLRTYPQFTLASLTPIRKDRARETDLLSTYSKEEQRILLSLRRPLGDQTTVLTPSHPVPINRDWTPWSEYYLGRRRSLGGFDAFEMDQRIRKP